MTQDVGRVPQAEPGSRASTEPQSSQGLGPTGFDPSRWAGRILIRCVGGSQCNHGPGECTADPEYQRYIAWQRRDHGRPAYAPTHKLPTWLSSEDVLTAIRALAEAGLDKAACWDFTQAIYGLVERSRDSDGPRMAETNEDSARGEAGPARAEGIAQNAAVQS